MNLMRKIPIILTAAVLGSVLVVSSVSHGDKSSISSVFKNEVASHDEIEHKNKPKAANESDEMRGIWLTYIDLSMESEKDKSENAFRKKFTQIATKSREYGLNTLIVQVRPFCDALYDSDYFPYSHILTGTQGKNPDYDALKIMCEICREQNLKIHAWVNPYRVKISQTPGKFSEDNIYNTNRELTIQTESGIYLDPSKEEARELVINGVRELAKNYDIDGIQFDDYFYPPDINEHDLESYNEYKNSFGGPTPMNIDNWRLANVNMLINQVYRAIHEEKQDIQFGISPQGNINNNAEIYADVRSWSICKGFVDYICPQIYFSLDNPRLRFEDALDEWLALDFNENVSLYVGLAGYKAGSDSDEGTWLNRTDILSKEYEIIKSENKIGGFMLYSYASLIDDTGKKEMENLKNALN